MDALHRSVVAVLGSDVLETDAPDWLRLYDIGVLVLGVAALALVIALLTDAIVSTRLALALGGLPRRLRGHAIVCGLGTVGYRIGSELLAAGIDVCGVDIGDEERLARARSAGIAAAIGNGAQAATLRSLGVQEAAYLFCVTDDDVANLEAALVARAENPGCASCCASSTRTWRGESSGSRDWARHAASPIWPHPHSRRPRWAAT